jgi:hypothetical protein
MSKDRDEIRNEGVRVTQSILHLLHGLDGNIAISALMTAVEAILMMDENGYSFKLANSIAEQLKRNAIKHSGGKG